jgi:hypothetical protein
MIVVSPAIWESDGDDALVPHYASFQTALAAWVPSMSSFSNYAPTAYNQGRVADTWNPKVSCPVFQGAGSPKSLFSPPISRWFDEPIDMTQYRTYCPTYVAINWRLANSLTTVNPAAVVEIPFKSHTGWEYKLFLRVEKVP